MKSLNDGLRHKTSGLKYNIINNYNMATPPSITSIVPGNASVAITFTAASIPGDTVQYYGYQVSTSTDFSGSINIEFAPRDAVALTQTATQFWTGSSYVPFVNGTTYYFKVLAAFASAGWGGASAASGPIVPGVPPSAPTSLVATKGNTTASIAFTAGAAGDSPITNYQYSTDGTNFIAFSPVQTTSPVSITGLTNGTSYTVQLKAVSSLGASPASAASNSFTPSTVPSAPTSLVATKGDTSGSIAFTAGANGGSAITNYKYSTDSFTYIAFSPVQATSPVNITGLTNGVAYTVYLKAVNANGDSPTSVGVIFTPSTIPSAPTSLVATRGDQSASIAFTTGSNGGSTISNYKYSTDGTNYSAFSPAQTTSPVNITGLTNGTTYSITLKAVNANGDSVASSSASVTPSTNPASPTALTATPGNQSISVSLTPGSNGGAAINNYQFSTDNGATFRLLSPAQTTSPISITVLSSDGVTPLVNGTSYTIQLKAQNINGASPASSAVAATPSTTPSAPTSLVATHGNTTASIAFTAGSNGGDAITNYQYSVDGTNYTAFSPADITSPVVITGLTNGTTYSVTLKAVNVNGAGVASSSVSVTPSTTPSAPTSLSAAYGNSSATISFTAGSNGGNAISNYQYSLDGTNYTALSPAQSSSPVTVSGLTNGTTYSIYLKAVNINGASSASSSVSVTPSTVPSAPSFITSAAQNGGALLYFGANSNGGSAITNYQYSIDNGSNYITLSPVQTSNPLTVTGLTNGTSYNVLLKAVNVNGASAASNMLVVTPSTTPSAPTSLVVTNQNQSVSLAFTAGFNGGNAISNYQYSLDNGASFTAFSPTQFNSPVIITGLTNGNSYYIALKAVNSNGAGVASSPVLAQPVTLPSPPSALSGSDGNQSAAIAFTAGDTGGRPISNYQYSFDGINYTAFSPAQIVSPVTFTGLTNGTIYTIRLKTVTSFGASTASSSVTVAPSTVPNIATNLVATGGNQQVSIAFTAGYPEGEPIINYQYSLNDGASFTAFSPVQNSSPVLITGLTNGQSYTIRLKGVNADGVSLQSAAVVSVPGAVPTAPTALSAVDLYNGNISLSFTTGNNGGFNPINYQYSLDGGNTFTAFSPAQTVSPVIISGLTNRTSYTIQLKAVNVVGVGAASASLSLYYMCFLEGTNILCFNGSKEEYRKIESLRKGDLVKTFMDGYKAVDTIGFTKVYNPGNAMRSKNRLYKCTKEKYPSLTEDLVITGCHAILVDDITDVQKERLIEEQGKIYITDNHYRLIAMVDERAEPYQEEGLHTVWHLALENENYYYNYGIFANGLHVETTSKRMIKEQSGMTLME